MDWKAVGKGLLIADVVLVNAGVGYVLYKSEIQNSKFQTNPNVQNVQIPNSNLELDNKLAVLKREILAEVEVAGQSGTPVPSLTPAPTQRPSSSQATKTKVRAVSYVTVPGSGRSSLFDWVDLAGTEFYFDQTDYPGLVEAYFEASMSLFNGNGMAFVRLFDTVHGVGVQGSQVETASQATTVVQSGKLSFWAGKNLYRVQAKTLTSDTAVFSYGRLRVVTEN